MSGILSEKKADEIVIKNLMKEILRLKGLLKMSKLLMDEAGNIYLAEQYQLVAEAGVDEKIEEARKQIAEYEGVRQAADRLQAGVTAPAEPAPVEQPQPVEEPAPVPVSLEQGQTEAPGAGEPTPLPPEEDKPDVVTAETPVAPVVLN